MRAIGQATLPALSPIKSTDQLEILYTCKLRSDIMILVYGVSLLSITTGSQQSSIEHQELIIALSAKCYDKVTVTRE